MQHGPAAEPGPEALGRAAASLFADYQRDGRPADLDRAIELSLAAKAAAPRDAPYHEMLQCLVGQLTIHHFLRTGLRPDLDRAIDTNQAAADNVAGLARTERLTNLSHLLVIRYRRHGDTADLAKAVEAGQAAVNGIPAGSAVPAEYLANLTIALHARYERQGRAADLDRAIELTDTALGATGPGDPHHALYLANLGHVLLLRYRRDGDAADLDGAIEAGQAAVDAPPTGPTIPAGHLGNLAIALKTRYERHGRTADLDRAIELNNAALAATGLDDPTRALHLSNLGAALRYRFERLGRLADLDRAVAAGEDSVAAAQDGHPQREMFLSNLGTALRVRFEARGEPADLDRAIEVAEATLAATPPGHPNRSLRISALFAVRRVRYEQRGELGDLDRAITLGEAAVSAVPPDHPDRSQHLSNLGSTMLIRYERSDAPADLDRAIEIGELAVAGTPVDHPSRGLRLSSLAIALRERFAAQTRLTDLTRSVELNELAVAGAAPDNPNRAMYMTNLCSSLVNLYEQRRRPADIRRAVEVGTAAVAATPTTHPKTALRLLNLGRALTISHGLSRDTADLTRAAAAFRAATELPIAVTKVRLEAAREWGNAAIAVENWPSAADALAAAIDLIARIAPRSLHRSDQEYWLSRITGLGSLAAACCLQAGQQQRAVQLWEQGRGVLLGQALDIRTDLRLLTERHPGPAAEFVRLRDELDNAHEFHGHPTSMVEPATESERSVRSATRRRGQVAEQFDQLIALIRAQPGFERFLLPLSVDELLAAGADGPVVMINVTAIRSDALVLTPSGVRSVALPAATPQALEAAARRFLTALAVIHRGTADASKAEQELTDVLGWLWDAIAGPVLDRVEQLLHGARLWWCSTGILSLLPLHAAGHHDTRGDRVPRTVLDRVVSAYTPTVRALTHARRPPAGLSRQDLRSARLLVVAMPATPALNDLPGVAAEAAMLASLFGRRTQILSGPEATHDSVSAALRGNQLVHFACHAASYPNDPSASRLLLHDHQHTPLTVLDLAQLRLDDAELAFLSACETAQTGVALGDEALQLAAACQIAGYRHVVATLWPISDTAAVDMATDFYAVLASRGIEAAARALHTATRRRRDRCSARPSGWAAYVYCGA